MELKSSTFYSPLFMPSLFPQMTLKRAYYPLPHKIFIILLLCSLSEPHLFVMVFIEVMPDSTQK